MNKQISNIYIYIYTHTYHTYADMTCRAMAAAVRIASSLYFIDLCTVSFQNLPLKLPSLNTDLYYYWLMIIILSIIIIMTIIRTYGQLSKFHVCFCGLDPGNLKFETVRTHKQRICF